MARHVRPPPRTPTRASTPWSGRAEPAEGSIRHGVYRMIELAGWSAASIEDAIQHAIARAAVPPHDLS